MRTENVIRNALFGVGGQVLHVVCNFALRTVFISMLGIEFLGINALFANILSVLSLAELGIGLSINFALYEPLAKRDESKIASLMELYRKSYFYIGIAVLTIGLLLLPFLPWLVKGDVKAVDLKIVYILFLLQSVSSYWFGTYISSILIADQKEFLYTIFRNAAYVCGVILRIGFLYLLRSMPARSFYVYSAIGIVVEIGFGLSMLFFVYRRYGFLRTTKAMPLAREEKKNIFKNVIGLSISKVSFITVSSVGSIIIAGVIGVVELGLYSNYQLILSGVNTLLTALFSSLTASIGNLCCTGDGAKKKSVFDEIELLYIWVYGWSAVMLWVLYNPFIGDIWLTKSCLLAPKDVFAIVVFFLCTNSYGGVMRYRDAAGLFWQIRYRCIASVIVNIGLSLLFVLVFRWGIAGTLYASTISICCVSCWYDSKIVFHNVFGTSCRAYLLKHIFSIAVIFLVGGISTLLIGLLPLPSNGWLRFLALAAIGMVVPNACFYLFWGRTTAFGNLKKRISLFLAAA